MRKITSIILINCFTITLCFTQTFPSWQLGLLYNWNDTTLTPSAQYDNTYNEIWGVQLNGVEVAIIGSTDIFIEFNTLSFEFGLIKPVSMRASMVSGINFKVKDRLLSPFLYLIK